MNKETKKKIAFVITIALIVVNIGFFKSTAVRSSTTNIASNISWSCITVDNQQPEASMSWQDLINPPEFTDATNGSFSKVPTAAGFTFNIKSTGKDAIYTNGVATADDPTKLKVYSTGTMNVEKGMTYTVSFKIKSTLYGKLYENGVPVTDGSGNEVTERNYIKHIGFRIYDETTNQGINFTNLKEITTDGIMELDGQNTDKKSVRAKFTVPSSFPSNTINAQFLFGARMVTYPNEVSMKGDVVVTNFQILSQDSEEITEANQTTQEQTSDNQGGELVIETDDNNTVQPTTEIVTTVETTKTVETTTKPEITTANNPQEDRFSDDLSVTGYQLTTSFRNNPGVIGHRIIYQTNQTVEGEVPQEVGVVFAFDYDGTIGEDDFVVGSNHEFVATHQATPSGRIDYEDGDPDVNYYALTMDSGEIDLAFTTSYYVRAYAKMNDGSYVYSNDIGEFSVFDLADELYPDNTLSQEFRGYLLEKVLKVVDPNYSL